MDLGDGYYCCSFVTILCSKNFSFIATDLEPTDTQQVNIWSNSIHAESARYDFFRFSQKKAKEFILGFLHLDDLAARFARSPSFTSEQAS